MLIYIMQLLAPSGCINNTQDNLSTPSSSLYSENTNKNPKKKYRNNKEAQRFDYIKYVTHPPFKKIFNAYIKKRNIEKMKTLITQELGDINSVDKNGHTLLHHATQFHDTAILKTLLNLNVGRQKIDINKLDYSKRPPLFYTYKNREAAELLIKKGADLDVQNLKAFFKAAQRLKKRKTKTEIEKYNKETTQFLDFIIQIRKQGKKEIMKFS